MLNFRRSGSLASSANRSLHPARLILHCQDLFNDNIMSFPLSIPYLTNCINFIFVNVSLIKLKVQLCFHFSVHLDNIQLHQTWLIIISTTTLQTSLLQSMSGSLPSSFCRSTKQSQSTVFHFSGLRKLLQSSICERTRNDV